jgi:hypothetical protein
MVPLSDRQIRQVSNNPKARIVAGTVSGILLVSAMVTANLIWGDPESPLMVVLSAAGVVLLLGVLLWLMVRNPG